MKQTIREWWGGNVRWWFKFQRRKRDDKRFYRRDFRTWKKQVHSVHRSTKRIKKEHRDAGKSILEAAKPQSDR